MSTSETQTGSAKLQKILVQTGGSRGDMQPYIPLASALQDAGYDVIVATNENHQPPLEKAGLKFVGILPDSDHEMKTNPKVKNSMETGNAIAFTKAIQSVWADKVFDYIDPYIKLLEEFKPDLVVSGTMCEVLAIIAERHHGIPFITVQLQYQGENPPRVTMGLPNLPCCLKTVVQRLSMRIFVHDMIGPATVGTKKKYGYDINDLWTPEDTYNMKFKPVFGPILIGVNEKMARTIYGETPNVVFLGQFAVDDEKQLDKEKTEAGGSVLFGDAAAVAVIEDFLGRGSKPIYMGFGSMTAKSTAHMITLLVQAAKLAGVRAIIQKGWANMDMDALSAATKDADLIKYAEDNILFVGKAPHAWLFPRCSVIIHHGGAGTVHTAARGGSPQIIVPVFLDQWDHAWFLNTSGCGYGFERVGLTNIRAPAISDAIKKVLSTPSIATKAAEWATEVRADPGAAGAVPLIEKFFADHVATGKYKKYVDERKKEIAARKCC